MSGIERILLAAMLLGVTSAAPAVATSRDMRQIVFEVAPGASRSVAVPAAGGERVDVSARPEGEASLSIHDETGQLIAHESPWTGFSTCAPRWDGTLVVTVHNHGPSVLVCTVTRQ
jgi:hypothetical protein